MGIGSEPACPPAGLGDQQVEDSIDVAPTDQLIEALWLGADPWLLLVSRRSLKPWIRNTAGQDGLMACRTVTEAHHLASVHQASSRLRLTAATWSS